ncbi:MAG: hypothetical protein PHI12_09350 [Dehalococcoidales bacterium]|nr:hypothetical protein [Dehalococcoidales bacterium]
MDTTIIAIVTPIITAASTLLAVWLTQRNESRKRGSEEKRWYADYFLGRKIDALNNLFTSLVDCYFAVNRYGNYAPSTYQEYIDEVVTKEDSYLKAKVAASIYLDNEVRGIMSHALGAFRLASIAIRSTISDDKCHMSKDSAIDLDWFKLEDSYNKAVVCLENLLNPEVLKKIEE